MSGAHGSSARRASLPSDEDRTRAGDANATNGAVAAAHWHRGLRIPSITPTRWHCEIALDTVDAPAPASFDEATATRFHIDIYSEEWGVFFCHDGRASWIRVTDIAFVHGRDEHRLLGLVPSLKNIGALLRRLEQQHEIVLRREHATIRTNLVGAEPAIRRWLAQLSRRRATRSSVGAPARRAPTPQWPRALQDGR